SFLHVTSAKLQLSNILDYSPIGHVTKLTKEDSRDGISHFSHGRSLLPLFSCHSLFNFSSRNQASNKVIFQSSNALSFILQSRKRWMIQLIHQYDSIKFGGRPQAMHHSLAVMSSFTCIHWGILGCIFYYGYMRYLLI
ncbi:hypothetical protein CFOL_v3_30539, partial [Cephalotus follicularis]